MIEPRLATLELRRTASGALVLVAVVLVALVASLDWTPDASRFEADLAPELLRGLERETMWTAVLVLLVPALVLHCGGIVSRWRKREADWFGALPRSRAHVLTSTAIGGIVGASLLIAAAAVAIEIAIPSDSLQAAGAPRESRADSIPDYHRLEPGAGTEVRLPYAGRGDGWRLRVQVLPTLGSAPSSHAQITVRGTGEPQTRRVHVTRRTWVEFQLAAGDPREGSTDIVCEVRNVGQGHLALPTPRTFELWAPGGSERLGSLEILARAACALAALGTFALGLGAWVGAATAALLSGLLWIAVTALLGAPSWWPGGDLARVLEIVGEGRLPSAFDPRSVLVALACAAAGIGVGALGLRSWRFAR